MTDQHRNALRTAQAFASVLIDSIDHEIKGGDPSWREEAATQLAQALRNIEPEVYNPDINRPSTQPYPQHIDSDRTVGPTDWDTAIQEEEEKEESANNGQFGVGA